MTDRELMQQELEALEVALKKNIADLRERLAQSDPGCAECGKSGGWALYCVACMEKLVQPEQDVWQGERMTRDDVEHWTREAGGFAATPEFLERFAALVAAAERETCARVCESMSLEWEDQPAIAQAELATLMDCALAIRSRSNP